MMKAGTQIKLFEAETAAEFYCGKILAEIPETPKPQHRVKMIYISQIISNLK